MITPESFRIGQGFDIHPFSDDDGRHLVLGGVAFPDERGLAGHSDADVVAHAVIDAILGGAGLGDIGEHFPDTDEALAGADSMELLRQAVASAQAHGWTPVNIDCTVVLDKPRISEVRHEIQHNISVAAEAPVSVKGKRTEGVGSLGRGEGVACMAVVLLTQATV